VKSSTHENRATLVSCSRNSMYFVAIKMGRRQGSILRLEAYATLKPFFYTRRRLDPYHQVEE